MDELNIPIWFLNAWISDNKKKQLLLHYMLVSKCVKVNVKPGSHPFSMICHEFSISPAAGQKVYYKYVSAVKQNIVRNG